MKMKLALALGIILLGGCNFQQDPLSGAPESVRTGVPPNKEKPVEEKILDKNVLQIDAPNLVNGRVGSDIDFKILGRVMSPGLQFQLSIDNMSEFPGATFDATTGQFKWSPLKSMMNGFPSIELPLRVTMATIATKDNPTVSVEKKTVALVIVNQYMKPIVNTVTGPSTVVVGSPYKFPFEFEDQDAFSASDAALEVRDCNSYSVKPLGHFVQLSKIEAVPNKPNHFKGEALLDLARAENLATGTYCLGLMAISKFGVISDVYSKEFKVEAKMKAPRSTAERLYEMTVGDKVRISFSIFDPAGEGFVSILSMDSIADILPGSMLACTKSTFTRYQVDCAGVIDVTTAKPGTYIVKIQAENAATSTSQKTTSELSLRIQVKAATP